MKARLCFPRKVRAQASGSSSWLRTTLRIITTIDLLDAKTITSQEGGDEADGPVFLFYSILFLSNEVPKPRPPLCLSEYEV